ncbi:TPA: hypothetical protein KRH38_003288 [Clostridioides difficile]|uniref:hypothetical protein n=1 Tax=Clostridioides difficile TaxID=1496 RepID=UPI001C17F363|nr:hypothetical protein [Clostridioides difficile]
MNKSNILEKKEKKKKLCINHQILKIDSKNCFLEVMANSFTIDKVLINFRKYDNNAQSGEKFTQQVDIFIDPKVALLLCHDILSGKIAKLATISQSKAEKEGSNFPTEVWRTLGGTSAKELKKQNRERKDGCAVSRSLKLLPGEKKGFLFTAESGKGKETDKGLIVPKYGRNPDNRVVIPLDSDQLKIFAIMIKTHIEAFLALKYNPYIPDSFCTIVEIEE